MAGGLCRAGGPSHDALQLLLPARRAETANAAWPGVAGGPAAGGPAAAPWSARAGSSVSGTLSTLIWSSAGWAGVLAMMGLWLALGLACALALSRLPRRS